MSSFVPLENGSQSSCRPRCCLFTLTLPLYRLLSIGAQGPAITWLWQIFDDLNYFYWQCLANFLTRFPVFHAKHLFSVLLLSPLSVIFFLTVILFCVLSDVNLTQIITLGMLRSSLGALPSEHGSFNLHSDMAPFGKNFQILREVIQYYFDNH